MALGAGVPNALRMRHVASGEGTQEERPVRRGDEAWEQLQVAAESRPLW